MRVLVVNAGSSSLKLSLVEDGRRVHEHTVERWQGEGERRELADFVGRCGPVDAVAHRVVHGGARFSGVVEVSDVLLDHLDDPDGLAPLHNPRAATGIRELDGIVDASSYACFDTTFHADLPPAAATYAVPRAWNERWSLRRYGAHGLSHAYAVRRGAELVGRPLGELRVVSAHLGSGASLAAVVGGRSVDTTMGLTPLEGLVMGTRSGSVDPGLLLWVQRSGGLSADEVDDALQHESGLRGLSASSDLRDVLDARADGDPHAELAYDVLVHRLRRELGAMVASANGLDLLVFTGGIGEHVAQLRRDAVAGLSFLGMSLDDDRNEETTGDADVSGPGPGPRVVVVSAGEDLEMALQVADALA